MEGSTARLVIAAATGTPTPPSSDAFLPRITKNSNNLPPLTFTKPSWTVRTESNVWKERRRIPCPHCVICGGSGRVDCRYCQGKGRTNSVHRAMLPKGEWPKWCRTCGGSGLGYCSRCLGTGEYRDIMGFHFMKDAKNQGSFPEKLKKL